MMKKKTNFLYIFDFISDVIVIFVSYVLAMFIRYEIMNSNPGLKTLSLPYLLVAFIYSIVISSIFAYMQSSSRFYYHSKNNGAYNIFVVNAVGCLCLLSFFYIIGLIYFSRGALLIFWCISSALLLLKKDVLIPWMMKNNKMRLRDRNVLLVGDGKLASDYLSAVKDDYYIWLNIVGYIGDKDNLISDKDIALKRLGGFDDIRDVIENTNIDEVVFAISEADNDEIERLCDFIRTKDISISMVPNLSGLIPLNASMHRIGSTKVIDLSDNSKGILGNASWLGIILSVSVLVVTLILNIFKIGFLQDYEIYGTYKSIMFAIFGFCLFSMLFGRFKKGRLIVSKLAVSSWVSCVAFATVYEILDSFGNALLPDLRMDVIVITITVAVLWIVFSIIHLIENDSTPFLF